MKKKILCALFLTASVVSASAQSAFVQERSSSNVELYTLPRTVISVTVTQEREVILRGPYARYASQYLGIIGAAQSDKEIYKILGASLNYIQEPDPDKSYVVDEKSGIPLRVFQPLTSSQAEESIVALDSDFMGASISNNNPFTDVGATIIGSTASGMSADRTSVDSRSADQMAAEAAATIFKLRKRRIDLICGDQGENVFGAGLQAALDEIARLEKEYLELFVGKRYVQTTTKTVYVLPVKGESRIVACRFSESSGVTDASDLSASPLTLEISIPSKKKESSSDARKSTTRVLPVIVPDVAEIQLTFGDLKLARERIPMYQYSSVVDAPVI